jgi:hypothetical protein
MTALDVMTNGPITTPVVITSYINSMNRTTLPSPATIQNVPLNASIVALALDDMQIQPHLPAVIFGQARGTGLVDLTIMMGPQLVSHPNCFPIKWTIFDKLKFSRIRGKCESSWDGAKGMSI